MFQDKTLVCKDCGKEFVFTAGEQEFYAEKGFQNEPVRCKDCRSSRKTTRSSDREMFDAVFTEVAGFTAFARHATQLGLKVAVGTAGDLQNVQFAMARLKMDPLPLTIVRGDEGLRGKPEPDIFLEAARRIGADPARCIVFEDAPFGIEAARRGGMHAVAVCSTISANDLAGPHVLTAVRDYRELAQSNFLESLHVA